MSKNLSMLLSLRPGLLALLPLALACSDQDLKVSDGGPNVDTGSAGVDGGGGDGTGGGTGEDGGDGSDGGDVDADGDGYPAGEDCDDNDNSVNPGATEVCDGIDNDCDDAVDDADDSLAGGITAHVDGDGDGFGSDEGTVQVCALSVGQVEVGGDCDDSNSAIHPDAMEVCDGGDNDCDGAIDDDDDSLDLSTSSEWFEDADGDGYGADGTGALSCVAPPGWVADDTDCDDGESAANPGEAEVCDGIDNDCDGDTDDADADVDLSTARDWYQDGDGDGYGNPAVSAFACSAPAAHVTDNTDCNDGIGAINPGATEVCDGLDNDCDGDADDDDSSLDTSTATTWYTDGDGDGYGLSTGSTVSCDAPTDGVELDGDCDDGDDGIHPGAAELCDGVDDDCDGVTTDEAGQVSFTPAATGVMVDITATVAGTSSVPGAATLATDGTATFCDGTHYTNLTVAADVALESRNGAATTALDGAGAGTVLTIQTNSISVDVSDLTIQNGQAGTGSYEGGGIECYASSTLSVSDVVFDNNVGEWGGGLGSLGCTVTVSDSTFSDNEAQYGGGLLGSQQSSLTIDSCSFTDNSATISGGDVLVIEVDDATISSSTLADGSAAYTAGSVFVQGSGTETFTLEDTAISGSTAADAGAVFVYDAEVECTEAGGIRDTSATLPGAVYVSTGGSFTSWGCDLAASTATDDNDADAYTSGSGETFSDYGDDAWFSCTEDGCGGVEFDGFTGTFELDLGVGLTTPVAPTNCALEWDLVGVGLDPSLICEDCDFGFDVDATYDAAASVDDGTCTPVAADFSFLVAFASEYTSYGYDVMMRYDTETFSWEPWWAASFDGTELVFYYGYADYYVGDYYGYPVYATRYEYGIGTVY